MAEARAVGLAVDSEEAKEVDCLGEDSTVERGSREAKLVAAGTPCQRHDDQTKSAAYSEALLQEIQNCLQ